jgi:hypothetical protein
VTTRKPSKPDIEYPPVVLGRLDDRSGWYWPKPTSLPLFDSILWVVIVGSWLVVVACATR